MFRAFVLAANNHKLVSFAVELFIDGLKNGVSLVGKRLDEKEEDKTVTIFGVGYALAEFNELLGGLGLQGNWLAKE